MGRRPRHRCDRNRSRLIASFGVAVLTAGALAAARASLDGPAPRAAVLVTAANPATPPDPVPTTAPLRPGTTTTRAPLPPTAPPAPPTTVPTTSTTSSTRPAAPRTTTTVRTRTACLALAEANHYAAVSANARWFDEQMQQLSSDPVLRARQFEALRIEESWALKEMDVQYAIDRSNCYLE